ncbi:MAG: S1 RNA-binding domain-containing protein, partial [Patescibacteria group bacterium]
MTTQIATVPKKSAMESLMKSEDSFFQSRKLGDIVSGRLLAKKGNSVYVDLGFGKNGIIYGREYLAAADLIKKIKVGEEVKAKIVDEENEDGYIELSLKEAGAEMKWDEFRKKMEEKSIVSAKILDANTGGLVVNIEGEKGFLPVSHLSSAHYPRVEGGAKDKILEELKKFAGKEINVRIIDLNQQENKLIVSEKAVGSEIVRKELEGYKIGDVIDGTVNGVVDFGAFIKFGNDLEGLCHVSEIDWKLIEKPSDVLKPGQDVQAKIIGIDGPKVSLSLKALKTDPWLAMPYKKDDVVEGGVTKHNSFGAFIQLDADIHGLCHISEFRGEEEIKKQLELRKKYKFKNLGVDAADHKMPLS